MDWAKNYQGEIVQARRGAYFGFDLRCPTCGEPVLLRAGKERRPHFAHYSNRAKPDCEYYYPPPDILQRLFPRLSSKNSALLPRPDSLRCGLFLAYRSELHCFDLFLRIPSIASVEQLSGILQIQHGMGVKSFSAKQLTKAYIVSVSPKVPLLECTGTGDLFALSDHLLSQTSSFLNCMNLFVATETGGRFMFSQETLEWGKRYWVVTEETVTPNDQLLDIIEWSQSGSLAKWHVYEAKLPATLAASRWAATGQMLAEFFCRPIRPPRPRAYVVYPPPHHIATDGAYIYPQAPDVLYVRRTSNHEVSVEGPADLLADTRVKVLADNWVKINGIRLCTQDVTILIKGVEQVIIRTEACSLIQPSGLRAKTKELSWDIHTETPLSSQHLFSQEIRVECDSYRLAEYVTKINEGWILDGTAVILPENTDKTLIAGGFGEIRQESHCLAENQDVGSQELADCRQHRLSPRGTWISGLIRTKFGPRMEALVRNFIADPSYCNMNKLGPILTSPLMVYVRIAVENQQHK